MSIRDKAVVLVSGGMDSCVTAAIAATQCELAMVHVSYGQRTEARERRAFEEIADYYLVRERLAVRMEHFAKIGGSALTDARIAVPEAEAVASGEWRVASDQAKRENRKAKNEKRRTQDVNAEGPPKSWRAGAESAERKTAAVHWNARGEGQPRVAAPRRIPITYVPFRNAQLLGVAVSWAEVIGAEKVYIGAVEEDSSGYPDCRPEFYRSFQEAVRAGTKPESRIEIVTPVIALKKSEIVRRGIELGAPLHLTWSCYQFEDVACGMCESCRLRLRGFAEAGVEDPIAYRARVGR